VLAGFTATLHRHTSWGDHCRVALHESGDARPQICACRIAAAYADWIALQSIAAAGDTSAQQK
jgi:hypothetical protein